jgi:HNH endonuclease
METKLPSNDLELKDAFSIILSIEKFSDYIYDIVELIYKNELNKETLDKVLDNYKIESTKKINEELLDLLIVYTNLVLNDNEISTNEINNIRFLKLIFGIKEGDFYKYRKDEVEEVLRRQFYREYYDNTIDKNESIHNVNLQEIFDLGYDQFDNIKKEEILNAIDRGAKINELDTAIDPRKHRLDKSEENRHISQKVKDLVWNRDQGKCVICGSNKKIEFDHIIPFSKGGSNTYRNIQLLCENCNRKKSNSIG